MLRLSPAAAGIVLGGRITRDHLGSIREVLTNSVVVARYDFDLYGRRTLVSGTDVADFGFTGHFVHKPSGLLAAMYRFYDPNLGRWLSRDPLEDAEFSISGPNLYRYAINDPINWYDPLGLQDDSVTSSAAGDATGETGQIAREWLKQQAREKAEEKAAQEAAKKAAEEAIKKRLSQKAEDVIAKECKGSINQKFPEELRKKTLDEINKLAQQGDKAAQTARKLLTDGRFKK